MKATDPFTRVGRKYIYTNLAHNFREVRGTSKAVHGYPVRNSVWYKGMPGLLVMFFFDQGASYRDIFSLWKFTPLYSISLQNMDFCIHIILAYIFKQINKPALYALPGCSFTDIAPAMPSFDETPGYCVPFLSPEIQFITFNTSLDISS